MCQFFSFIADNEGRFYYSRLCSSHEAIIAEHKLNDSILHKDKRKIARLEYSSKTDLFDFASYELIVDERESPKWFNTSMYKAAKCFAKEKIKEFVFVDQNNLVISQQFCYLKNSSAVLRENSNAVLRENSSAVLRENSRAVLRENSNAVLWENSSAVLRENSSAVLRENSRAELQENSSAVLRENSRAVLWENSSAVLRENSNAVLRENSSYFQVAEQVLYISKECKFKIKE